MSTINEKFGFKPAGQRAMMKSLPRNRELRTKVTSAKCPSCGQTGARASKTKGPGWLYCTWCNHVWELPRVE